ncbi:BhlA/UviB family holin-like peptide [Clostridium septicum]|uniref:BhlA/UviB family holin-like peptide n=1 Tax=Clostridium septicum TaxID=1504 RepID=UPI00082B1790|nr:BhlA/UviB family holin-like peptide [Clostridium septicum]
MTSELLNFLTSHGVFALLFGYLLIYVLNQNQIREENYQKIIQDLNSILPNIKSDLDDIKKKILNSKDPYSK